MPLVEFVGQSAQDQGNVAINTARLVNCYREPVVGQGKTQYVIQNVLGQTLLADTGALSVRAMGRADGQNYVAGNSRLWGLAGDGTLTEEATIPDDVETVISGSYSIATITADDNYYVWNGTTLSQPTTKTFTDVRSHFYIGGYTVLLEDGGKRFQWSDLGDATTLDALNFASADKVDDNLIRGFEVQGTAILMCETSAEMWQITGSGSEAFTFVTSWNRGLKSHNLAVKFDDSLFFVGDDNNVYLGVGPGATDITPPGLNTSLEENTATHCFYYEDRGHKFCVLRFSDRPAWVYDVKVGEWHERSEGANTGPFRAIASIEGDTWQIGNSAGEVHSLSRTGVDLNAPLRRTMVSQPLYLGDNKFRVPKLELGARVGEVMLNTANEFALSVGDGFALEVGTDEALAVGSTDGSEVAGVVNLAVSRDGGRTWTADKPRSLGLSAEYETRLIWRSLGQAQQFAVRVRIDEPADYQVNSTAVLQVA